MGGDGGYIRYHPDAILLNEDKAPTVVTSFSLWNKEVRPGHRIGKRVALPRSILHSDRLRLRHNENSFRFYFRCSTSHRRTTSTPTGWKGTTRSGR